MAWLSRKQDGAWAWLVLVAVMLSQTIVGGSCLTGGVMYVIFSNALGSNPVTLSWLCALPISAWFFAAPIGSFLTNKYGCRACAMIGGIVASVGISTGYFANGVTMLFFSYGILSGVGYGINYTASMSVINKYFHKYKTLATGFTSIGHNVGLVVYSKLLIELDEEYTWNGVLLILGGISFNMCAFAACMAPVEDDADRNVVKEAQETNGIYTPVKIISVTDDGVKIPQQEHSDVICDTILMSKSSQLSDKLDEQYFAVRKTTNEESQYLEVVEESRAKVINLTLFKKPSFVLLCISNILTNIAQGIYILHLPSFSKGVGFNNDGITKVMTVYGLVNVFAKVVFSSVGQHPRVNSTLLYTVSIVAAGVGIGLNPVFQSETSVFILAAVVGCFYCVTGALIQAVIYTIVGYDRFPDGVGLSLPFKATGNLIGGPVAGFLLETSGTYDTSFYLAGVSLILAAVCLLPAIIKEHRQGRTHEVVHELEVEVEVVLSTSEE